MPAHVHDACSAKGRFFCTLLGVALSWSTGAQSAETSPPPIEAFARTPYIADVAIASDRRFLSFITSSGDNRSIVAYDRLGKLGPKTLWESKGNKDVYPQWCGWVNHERVLCSLLITRRTEKGGVGRQTRLFASNFDGTRSGVLLNDNPKITAWYRDRIIHWPAGAGGDTVLIELDERRSTGAYRLNVYTGAVDHVLSLSGSAYFATDPEGNVRLARVINGNASTTHEYRLKGQSGWHEWSVFSYDKPSNEIQPTAVLAGGNRFLGRRAYDGRIALWEWDLQRVGNPQLLFSSKDSDIGDLAVTRSRVVLGVMHEAERPAVHYLDARARSVVAGADRIFPGKFNSIHDVTGDMSAYIVHSASDIDGGTYHLLVASEGAGDLQQLGTAYPELADRELGRMKLIHYTARDGVAIPAYLTLPLQESPDALIVMPHDGPDDRTSWSFDYLRAFLVSRGYAVLQMNYRGSSGYGEAWKLAGIGEWRGTIHDDIEDGARWAIEQKIVAPDRLCIAGRGFGGLQALLAASEDADLYRCAISIGGWSDLVTARHYADYWVGGAFDQKDLGETSDRRLLTFSPLNRASKFAMPVFLAHADLDMRIPASHSLQLADRLKRACKPHRLLIMPNTDSDRRWQSDRMALLSGIESFLQQSLSETPIEWPELAGCKETQQPGVR